jgi:hypothetical protein
VLFLSSANDLVIGDNNQAGTDLFLRDRTSNTTVLVSANYLGTGGGNNSSSGGVISTNGRYVVFESMASDLVPGDTNGASDVFLRDLATGTTTLVSVSTNGGFGNRASSDATIAPDGRFVCFLSIATDLVVGDANFTQDVFLRDLQTQTTTLISVGATGPAGLSALMGTPVMTPDGQFIAYFSSASNIVAAVPANSPGEIYLRDVAGGQTFWASTNASLLANLGNVPSTHPSLSADGRFVTFKTGPTNGVNVAATNQGATVLLQYDRISNNTAIIATNGFPSSAFCDDRFGPEVTPDGRFIAYVAQTVTGSNAFSSVHVWDTQQATDTLVSQDFSGGFPTNSFSDTPSVSSDGRYVLFLNNATNLVANAVSNGFHIYLRDLQAGSTQLIDTDGSGPAQGNFRTYAPALSSGGGFVAFSAPDGSLVANDNNQVDDVFLRNTVSGGNELISVREASIVSRSGSGFSSTTPVSVSTDGRWVAFSSSASDLVTNDFNNDRDVFLRDILQETNFLVSVGLDGTSAKGGYSTSPAISANGRYVGFISAATNLVANDTNGAADIFVRDMLAGVTTIVSVNSNQTALGNGDCSQFNMSQDGRYFVYLCRTNALLSSNAVFWSDVATSRTVLLSPTTGSFQGIAGPSIGADGRYVAYIVLSTQLFVWDSQLMAIVYTNASLASAVVISPTGTQFIYATAGSASWVDFAANTNRAITSLSTSAAVKSQAQWSQDGRYFVLATGGAASAVYVYDTITRSLTFVDGSNLAVGESAPVISRDGRFIAFRSSNTNLAPGISNSPNLFLLDRLTGTTNLLTTDQSSTDWISWVTRPAINGDGKLVAFQSTRSRLVQNKFDLNKTQDVFGSAILPWGNTDTDGDGMPDLWMLHYFGHATAFASDHSLATDDADGDGMSNLQEFLAGTDPTLASSVLRIQISATVGAGGVLLSWPAVPGFSYRLQFNDQLGPAIWQDQPGQPDIVGFKASQQVAIISTGRLYRVAVGN